MKVNLKTPNEAENAAATPICHQRGQMTVNGIIGNTRRGIVVDKTLDPDSNNPVANKPVSTALATLAGKIDAALQKPTGLTKTKLVGVGTSGQENIEIGDNLTLANGKLSAMGGGSNVNILTGSQPEASDNGYVGTYSGVPDESKINILHIENFADFVITLSMGGYYSGYVNAGTKFIISLLEGEYKIEPESESNKNPINIITKGDEDNKFNGTLVSPGLTLFSYKVPDQSFYVSIPVSSNGMWGTGTVFGFDDDSINIYVFYEFDKSYEVQTYHLKYYTHFITLTNSVDNVVLYLTIQKSYIFETGNTFNTITLASYLAGKKVLVTGNLHGVVPTYIAGEDGVIKIYYMTPGDNNINPTPDEYQDLSSFEISELVSPVD